METEPEELQFLGIFGVFREAYKILISWRRIFSGIAISLILPLSFVFLLHVEISDLIFTKIRRNEDALEITPADSPKERRILHRLASEWLAFALFKAGYLLAVLVLSLLSISAVVYAVACAFTAKNDISFRQVLTVVPKVWRRLIVTFLWNFAILFAYNAAAVSILILFLLVLGDGIVGLIAASVITVLYLIGFVYISVIWHVASVVSVLEDTYGIGAMVKSRTLIRGKAWVASGVFVLFNFSFVGVEAMFRSLVVRGGGSGLGMWMRLGYGAMTLSLMSMLVLVALVVQSVIYFVCKSYHHESIDKSSLADHLEVYLGEYVPLKERDVQLEQYDV